MSRYKLGKAQIKRLLEDKPIMDGRGRKFIADKETKDMLREYDKNNWYDKFDIIFENGSLVDLVKR